MNIFVNNYGESWRKVTKSQTQEIKNMHHKAWQEFKGLSSKSKATGLRDINFIVNKIISADAYNFSVRALTRLYKPSVTKESIHYISDKPLLSLYAAPLLEESIMPILVPSLKNQCYIKEDYINTNLKQNKILICATGNSYCLNMPLAVFHAYATRIFDGIVYFFDIDRAHYKDKKSDLSRCVDKLLTMLNPSSLGFIGTSAGACPAVKLYLENTESRVMAASPIFDRHPEITGRLLEIDDKKLQTSFKATYANNTVDMQYKNIYQNLTSKAGVSSIYDMTYISQSHASLASTLISQDFIDILKWLSGEDPKGQKGNS